MEPKKEIPSDEEINKSANGCLSLVIFIVAIISLGFAITVLF